MNDSEVRQTALHYNDNAAAYDARVDGVKSVTAVREAFCSLVDRAAGAGGTILDFGCGTGTDAHWYVQRGHHVIAHDISSGMLAQLAHKYPDDVSAGRIVIAAGSEADFAAFMRTRGPADVVAANFAVLNHFDDLRACLEQLAGYVKPNGALIASFINPWNIRDMRRLWWWKLVLRDAGAGKITVRGAVTTHRYYMRAVRRAAAPGLRVTDIVPAPPPAGTVVSRLAPQRLRSGALFVTMRKAAALG